MVNRTELQTMLIWFVIDKSRPTSVKTHIPCRCRISLDDRRFSVSGMAQPRSELDVEALSVERRASSIPMVQNCCRRMRPRELL